MQVAVTEQQQVGVVEGAPVSFAGVVKSPSELAALAAEFAASGSWLGRVRLQTGKRWYERLYQGPDHDIWAISWMPGQSTGFHDHGESSGAFVVATGVLEEHRPGAAPLQIGPGETRSFSSEYAHDVRNTSPGPAISIHAYSPPLSEMNEYELEGDELVPRTPIGQHGEAAAEDWRQTRSGAPAQAPGSRLDSARTIDQVLEAARRKLHRLSPLEADTARKKDGALLVDIRPAAQRAHEGEIPGALIVERNVLEWRFDPASGARLPIAGSYDLPVIVFCSEGYTSSLAAAALQELGLWRATDLVGGFTAWRAAGLPTG